MLTVMSEIEWQYGGCFCGEVRYRVNGPATWKAGCTCTTCVKMHSAPYVAWAGFERDNFQIVEGNPTMFRSSKHVLRSFCNNCGSTLTYEKDAAGVAELEAAARLVYIAVASLDDPELYPPDEVVHGREKLSWMEFGDSVPVREFTSKSAGELQFGGIDSDIAADLAKRHFGGTDRGDQ